MATRKKKSASTTVIVEEKKKPLVEDPKEETVNTHKGDPETLGWKLAKVLGEIHTIPKEGFNAHFNYYYVREDTLTEQIRPLLAKWGISLLFGCVKIEDLSTGDDRGTWTRVWCRFTLMDCDGNKMSVLCPGEGTDARHPDKALYKAMTGATKYFLYKTFLVSTGDDPERDDELPTKDGKKKQTTKKDTAKKETQTPQTQDANTPDMMTTDQLDALKKYAQNKDKFTEQLVKVLGKIIDGGGTEGSAKRILAECKRQNELEEKKSDETPAYMAPPEVDDEVPF